MNKKQIVTKAKVFWWKHGWKIAGIAGLLGMAYIGGKCEETHRRNVADKALKVAAEEAEKREAQEQEWKRKREEYEADPKNHLGDCGLVEDDFWDEGDSSPKWVNMIASDIPMDKLGKFGQELIKRAANSKLSEEDSTNLDDVVNENSVCSVLITICKNEDTTEQAKENLEEVGLSLPHGDI